MSLLVGLLCLLPFLYIAGQYLPTEPVAPKADLLSPNYTVHEYTTRAPTPIRLQPITESPPQIYFSFKFDDDNEKKLFDYGNDFIDALSFVQSEKYAGNEAEKVIESMLAKHHNNDEMYKSLSYLAKEYPKITRLYSVGESVEGRQLWALEITEEPGEHKLLKPEFKYVANIHGNEVVGRELLLHLARLLCENYRAADEELFDGTRSTPANFIQKLLKATRIHLMPSMNPDGYKRSKVGCKHKIKDRFNALDVDLNANFQMLIKSSIQPEVKAIMDWSKSEQFALSANLQGGSLVASYPYDGALNRSAHHEYRATPDDEIFINLANTYAKSHLSMSSGEICYDKCRNSHQTIFKGGITNGAERWSSYGTMQDWLYDYTNSNDITLFLGCNEYPEAGSLPQYWQNNKRALLNYILEVHRGIKGTIRDAVTGKLLSDVTVHVVNYDHNVTSTTYGDYFRILLIGSYEIVFERENYHTQRINVTISNTMAQPYLHTSESSRAPQIFATVCTVIMVIELFVLIAIILIPLKSDPTQMR